MSRNDDYTTENVLDYLYNRKYYKLIGIHLSRQATTSIPQKINFVEKLEEGDGAGMFFITEKQRNLFRFVKCNRILQTIKHQEIQEKLNLLNDVSNSNSVSRKWNIVSDQSNANYDLGNEITYNAEVLKSNLCNYNDTQILIRGDITVVAVHGTQVAFKSCPPFTMCITKIDGTAIDDAEDLEYSSSYSDATGSLWFYSNDEATNFNNDIVNTNNFKSFEYKAKLLRYTVAQPAPDQAHGILKNATIAIH